MANQDTEVTEVLQTSGEPTLERAAEKAQEQIDRLFNVSVSIAVTGETGAGKTSFINAIRGLGSEDEGAAEIRAAEPTKQPTPYQHPTMPNVSFWDLPGLGSPKYKAKSYLKDVKFDTYDFFLIISSERFKENDKMLAKEIQKMKKKFYFIRSKIDNDIRAEEGRKGFDREETLSRIRADCQENLKDLGNPQIFLICSKCVKDFDFERLCDAMLSDLPSIKQSALLQSVPIGSMAMLENKIVMFVVAAWAAAMVSGAVAVAPVPGLSLACNTGILLAFFTSCYYSFGLDDKSLENLSRRVNKPSLKHLIKSPLVLGLATKSALRMQLSAFAGGSIVQYLCSLVPGVGSAVAAAMSFGLTHRLLQNGLEELADTARTVLRVAGLQ